MLVKMIGYGNESAATDADTEQDETPELLSEADSVQTRDIDRFCAAETFESEQKTLYALSMFFFRRLADSFLAGSVATLSLY